MKRMATAILGIAGALLATACGQGSTGSGPSFDGSAEPIGCSTGSEATNCFEVTVTNVSDESGDGRCWVVAIEDYATELTRSDIVGLSDAQPGDETTTTVQLQVPGEADSSNVQFPVHCDPGREG